MANASLQVDLRAPATMPGPSAVAHWSKGQRVFVSSVIRGLEAERNSLAEAVEAIGAEAVLFERFGGRDDDPQQAYLSEVARSSIYVGLLGRDYGKLLPSRRSATHEEYRCAERFGLRICAWTSAKESWGGAQQEFIDEIRTFHVTGSFNDAAGLGQDVTRRLNRLAAEDLSPWCKVGPLVFRAAEVDDDGKDVHVLATVHDPAIVTALERLRPSVFSGEKDTRLTYADRSFPVSIRKVTTRVISLGGTHVDITFTPDRSAGQTLSASFSLWGRYTVDQITEIQLRKHLLGEPGPSGLAVMGGVGDPFAELRGHALPEDVLRPIARLLCTETMVGGSWAARILRLNLSAPIEGKRQLLLEWQPKEGRDPIAICGSVAF